MLIILPILRCSRSMRDIEGLMILIKEVRQSTALL